ncbi:unnamed protein product [Ilex paraguariensis]|uniref:Uncharacterized protein n=1 Tax=Ilex paraguariensis TaxID=185542 RepID=A0ABC8RBN2_9AQUA
MNLSSVFTILAMDSKRDQETKIVARNATSHVDIEAQPSVKSARQINCDRSHRNYDVCSFNGPTVFEPTESTFFLMGITDEGQEPILEEKVRPYPRKWDNFTMAQIKEVTLTSGPLSPPCLIHHNAPALVFSAGGYTDNFAYDFNDVFIPLFITVNSIFPSQEFIVAIFNSHDWWMSNYKDLLRSFTQHPIINLDKESVPHCFPSATVGLISHGFMTIDPKLMPSPKNFKQFRALLKSTYSPNGTSISKPPTRPRLVLMSNGGCSGGGGCVILNQAEVVLVAEEVGFKVIVFEPTSSTPLRESYN